MRESVFSGKLVFVHLEFHECSRAFPWGIPNLFYPCAQNSELHADNCQVSFLKCAEKDAENYFIMSRGWHGLN